MSKADKVVSTNSAIDMCLGNWKSSSQLNRTNNTEKNKASHENEKRAAYP
jgi:hypothetical protein